MGLGLRHESSHVKNCSSLVPADGTYWCWLARKCAMVSMKHFSWCFLYKRL